MKTNIHLWLYLAQFFLEPEMFQTKVVEKIKSHILYSPKIVSFRRENGKKYFRVGLSTDENMAHEHGLLDK